MTIQQFEQLTGITVPASQEARYEAAIARTQAILESMLGYSLDPEVAGENLYNELGKTSVELICPNFDDDNLLPPDPVIGAYRLFPYNSKDRYFAIDPYTQVNKVKLVVVRQGVSPQGITVKTFNADEMRLEIGRMGFAKYVERCPSCLFECLCSCTDCVQLAVDATWFGEGTLPNDLLYVWCDMVQFYTNKKRDIQSETLGSHSYRRFDNWPPEAEDRNIGIIKRYAGPFGTMSKTITVWTNHYVTKI